MTIETQVPPVQPDPASLHRPATPGRASAQQPLPWKDGSGPSRGVGQCLRFRNPAEIAVIQKLSVRRDPIPARRRERLDRQLSLPLLELAPRRAAPPDWPGPR